MRAGRAGRRVGWHDGPHALERLPVANRAAADAERPRVELEVVGRDRSWPRDEHLAAARVDHRVRSRLRRRERGQRRDARAGNVERELEAACDREPDAGAREAPRARFRRRSPRDPSAARPAPVRSASTSARSARAEPTRSPRTAPSCEEGARRDVGRGVEGENEHYAMPCSTAFSADASMTRRRSPPACSSVTATRGGGSVPTPASGHSTKTIAPSKYGSRSPHSAGETAANRYRSRWRHGNVAGVAMADGERRARHRRRHAELPARAPHERRLPRAQLARRS